MKFSSLVATLAMVGGSLAMALPDALASNEARAVCKKPLCKAKCPDGFPYDCCVQYFVDPCTNHYCKSKQDMECQCRCPNGTLFLCNVQYIRDPCSDLTETAPSV